MNFSENSSPVFIDPSLRKRNWRRLDPAPQHSSVLSQVEIVEGIVHAAPGSVGAGAAKASSGTRLAGPTPESDN